MKLLSLSLILFILLLASCATGNHPPLSEVNNVNPGIAKETIISKWGQPLNSQFVVGYHVLHYSFAVPNTLGVTEEYDFYFGENDNLAAWKKIGRKGKSDSPGFIIQLPQP